MNMIRESSVNPFVAGGALAANSPGYFGEIYDRRSSNIFSLSPRVIGSPKLTGKTTQLWAFSEKQLGGARDPSFVRIACEIPRAEGGVSTETFRELVGSGLQASEIGSLEAALDSSRVFKDAKRKIFALVGVDNLDEEALLWVLSEVKGIANSQAERRGVDVQLLVDGSFSVDTLTSGETSKFPLEQIFPREFRRMEQWRFVEERLRVKNVGASPAGLRKLWALTHGDKYLTQLLCYRWYEMARSFSEPGLELDSGSVESVATGYESENRYEELKFSFLESCLTVASALRTTIGDVGSLLSRIGREWKALPTEARASLYRGGAVRRLSETEVGLRAPMLLRILGEARERRERVEGLIRMQIPTLGIAESQRDTARRVFEDISRTAFVGALRAIHVGHGRVRRDGGVSVEMVGLDGERYKGAWRLDGDSGVADGEEAWGVLWIREPEPGWRQSDLRFFRMVAR